MQPGEEEASGALRKAGEGLSTGAGGARTGGHGFKLAQGSCRLGVRRSFAARVLRTRLPTEVVGAPSLQGFKARLEGASPGLVKVSLREWLELDDLDSFFPTQTIL